MEELLAHAAILGVRVLFAALGPQWPYGYVSPDGDIVINSWHSSRAQRVALAHELGHVHHGHHHHEGDPSHEARADEYAASLLIPMPVYAAIERTAGSDTRAIASALDMPVRIVEAWKRAHHPGPRTAWSSDPLFDIA